MHSPFEDPESTGDEVVADVSHLSILIVDDNQAQTYSLERRLKQLGWTVTIAFNGKDALEAVKQQPDVVLLDVNLPDLPGWQVCRQIRTNPETMHIPVIVISAESVSPLAETMAKSVGAAALLSYPIATRALISALREAIAKAA